MKLSNSAVGGSWSDAYNTAATGKNPSVGYVPPYQVTDFALGYRFLANYNIRVGINNLTDNKYFTRRTETLVYLGKGVLSGPVLFLGWQAAMSYILLARVANRR